MSDPNAAANAAATHPQRPLSSLGEAIRVVALHPTTIDSLFSRNSFPNMPDKSSPSERTGADTLFAFGEFVLDPQRQQLRRDGRPVALNAQPLKVLTFLVSHPDEVVTREALQQHIWGNVHVEYDQGINACIRQIRAALNDNPDDPRFVRTLRGTGYRFVAGVRRLASEPVSPSVVLPEARPVFRTRMFAGMALVLVSVAAVWWILRPDQPPAAVAAVTTSHNESELLRQQGLELLRRAHHQLSIDSARSLLNRSTRLSYSSAPPAADWAIALAFGYHATGKDSAARLAERLLGRAQALDPSGVETTLAAGYVDLFVRHDVDSALTHFHQAIHADSTRMFSLLGLGLAWRERGEWAHAISALSRAARLDTASELAATELGDALFHLRRYHDAHAVVSRVTVAPTSAALALLRTRLAVIRGNMKAANAALEDAAPLTRDSLLQLDPTLARILNGPLPGAGRALAQLVADTLEKSSLGSESLRRQVALTEGLLRAHHTGEAMDRLAWLLAVPSPVSLELVRRDPLWADARRTARYAELERRWAR